MAGITVVELMQDPESLRRMVKEVDDLEYASDFANLLKIMLDTIEIERERIESMLTFLAGPMKTFDAWQSFACSEEIFKEELRRWRERSVTD